MLLILIVLLVLEFRTSSNLAQPTASQSATLLTDPHEPKSLGKKKTTLERMVLCGLVEPGGIEPPSASPLQAVLHA